MAKLCTSTYIIEVYQHTTGKWMACYFAFVVVVLESGESLDCSSFFVFSFLVVVCAFYIAVVSYPDPTLSCLFVVPVLLPIVAHLKKTKFLFPEIIRCCLTDMEKKPIQVDTERLT